MCDDGNGHEDNASGHLGRRSFLTGLAALGAAGLGRRSAAAGPGVRPVTPDGLGAYRLGLHLHTSFSELTGSVLGHLQQAGRAGFDAVSFTDHDWRMQRMLSRRNFHFSDWSEAEFGRDWTLVRTAGAGLAVAVGTIRTDLVTPADTGTAKGSLCLQATASGTTPAALAYRFETATTGSLRNETGNLGGRTVRLDVLQTQGGGPDAYGGLRLRLSQHPAWQGLPAGSPVLDYRFRGDITVPARRRQGLLGIVEIPVPAGTWTTVAVDPASDAAALWPELPAHDSSIVRIELLATSGAQVPCEVFFGWLRLDYDTSIDPIGLRRSVVDAYRTALAAPAVLDGMEFSLGPHVNGFGPGGRTYYDYGPVSAFGPPLPADTGTRIVQLIHGLGGVASFNHPFGTDAGVPSAAGQRTALRRTVTGQVLATGAYGADLLEVGFRQRGGVTLAEHLALWDVLTRNGRWITGTGVSDDHTGNNYAGFTNRFYTSPWARSSAEPDLLEALRSGRSFVGYLGSFAGSLDLDLEGNPMGSVSVRTEAGLTARSLTVRAGGVPAGATVVVRRGAVDYAGSASLDPATAVVAELPASAFAATGSAAVTVDTGTSAFFRVEVVGSGGRVVAFSNPVSQLREEPPAPVPAARLGPN